MIWKTSLHLIPYQDGEEMSTESICSGRVARDGGHEMHYYTFRLRKEGNRLAALLQLDPTVGHLGHWEPVRVVGRPIACGKEEPKAGKARSNGRQPRYGFLSLTSL
jgi:hypothetical protein